MIESRRNHRIKDIRRLRRSKADRALLEGPHLLRAALDAKVALEFVLATPGFVDSGSARPLLDPVEDILFTVRADILESVADADSPRGLLAVAHLPRGGIAALPRAAEGVYVFADGLQEPGNLGALARVAEAAGAAGLALAEGSAHPNHPRALRASAGSLLRLPVAREISLDELEEHLRPCEPVCLALAPRAGEDLYEADLPAGAVVLMVGAEGRGLSPESLERAGRRLSLPMQPEVESLNSTVAAALALYEIARRRGRPSRA
jgi:TrmH family RNA methyltransferase